MWRLIKFSYHYATPVLLVIAILTGLSWTLLDRIRLEVSADQLLPRQSALREAYDETRTTFGSDKIAAIYIEDNTLFTYATLRRLEILYNTLSGLDGVQRVESLFNISHIKYRDGWLETGPILDVIPEDPKELQRIKDEAANNPLLSRRVISTDGKATLLTLYLEEGVSTAGDAQVTQGNELGHWSFERYIYLQIEEALKDFYKDFDQVFQVGVAAMQVEMKQFIIEDQRYLLPLSALLIIIVIGLALQSVHAAIIPICNATISSVWTLGLLAFLGIPINMLNYIVPVLIIVVGATEDVHILSEYIELRKRGQSGTHAMLATAHRIGLTLFLTAISTILGFAATGLTDIIAMQHFGVAASLGMFCRFIASSFFLPAYLSIFKNHFSVGPNKTREHTPRIIADKLAGTIMQRLVKHPALVILTFMVITVPSLYLADRIVLNNDLPAFLKKEAKVVQNINTVADRLSGSKVINITLKGNPGDFKRNETLRQLKDLTVVLRNREDLDTVVSLADYICLVNREMQGGGAEHFMIPENDSLIAQYLIFFHSSDLRPYATHDYSQVNIAIRTNIGNSTHFNRIVGEIRDLLESGRFGPLVYTITGKSVLVAAAVDNIAQGQLTSLSTITVLLFIIVSTLFLSLRCGCLAVLANLFSVAVIFGFMGVAQIPLNLGTCMVAAITIGIGVDDTLHLLVQYNRELKSLKDEKKALEKALRTVILPIIVTSIGLATGFFVLSFSSFLPVQQFGMLSAIVIVIAVIADMILTPALFSTTRLITLWDLLGIKLQNTLHDKCRLFQGMSMWQVKKFILLSHMEEYPAGTLVMREGELAHIMYIIIEGEMEVSKQIKGERTKLANLTLGDAVGEIALVYQNKRTADVRAITDTKMLAIDWESLEKIQRYAPYLASKFYLNLARVLGLRIVQTVSRIEKGV